MYLHKNKNPLTLGDKPTESYIAMSYVSLFFSTGLSTKAIANANGPIRPTNISIHVMSLPRSDRVDVMPVLSPTVPNADAVSKNKSLNDFVVSVSVRAKMPHNSTKR